MTLTFPPSGLPFPSSLSLFRGQFSLKIEFYTSHSVKSSNINNLSSHQLPPSSASVHFYLIPYLPSPLMFSFYFFSSPNLIQEFFHRPISLRIDWLLKSYSRTQILVKFQWEINPGFRLVDHYFSDSPEKVKENHLQNHRALCCQI